MPASGSVVRDRSYRAVADRGSGKQNPAAAPTKGTLRQMQSLPHAGQQIRSVSSWLCESTRHHQRVRSKHFQALFSPFVRMRSSFGSKLSDKETDRYWTLRQPHWTLVL